VDPFIAFIITMDGFVSAWKQNMGKFHIIFPKKNGMIAHSRLSVNRSLTGIRVMTF
jgi:hypothetical protein